MTSEQLHDAYDYARKLRIDCGRSLLSAMNKPNHTDKEIEGINAKQRNIDTICRVLLEAISNE